MLNINPKERPKADEALKFAYFKDVPPEQIPEITKPVDVNIVEAAFKFEKETLGLNELRVLISNDLFMSQARDPYPPHPTPPTPSHYFSTRETKRCGGPRDDFASAVCVYVLPLLAFVDQETIRERTSAGAASTSS